MDRNVIQATVRWCKWSEYELVNENIQPKKGAYSVEYNPFEHYTDELKMKKPSKIIPHSENYIHTSFANINCEKVEDILEWVNAYGVPYSYYVDTSGKRKKCFPEVPPQQLNCFAKDMSDVLSISEIVSEIKIFRQTAYLYWLIQQNPLNRGILRKWVNHLGFQHAYHETSSKTARNNPSGAHKAFAMKNLDKLMKQYFDSDEPCYDPKKNEDYEDFEDTYGGAVAIIQEYLSNVLQIATQSVIEQVVFQGNQLKVTYRYGSLLALMYKMLVFDWTKSREMRFCADKSCRRYFIPYHPSSVYCADECRNRVSAREYRQNHKEKLTQEQKLRRTQSEKERQAK